MSDIPFQPMPQTTAEYEIVFANMLTEIQRIHEEMQQDQVEIDRLRAESASFKRESERLKAEGKILNTDIEARLDSIRTTLGRLE